MEQRAAVQVKNQPRHPEVLNGSRNSWLLARSQPHRVCWTKAALCEEKVLSAAVSSSRVMKRSLARTAADCGGGSAVAQGAGVQ